jgi:hypothetical protein
MQEEEISFKEIYIKFRNFKSEIFKKWFVVLAMISLSSAFYYYKHVSHELNYTAEIKFIIEGQGGGGMGSLLSQFGFRSNAGPSKTNPFKVQEVAKSKIAIREILFNKLNGDFIANHILKEYKLNENNIEFQNFLFTTADYENFTTVQNKILKILIEKVVGSKDQKNPLLKLNYDEHSGIFSIEVDSKNEELTMKIISESYKYLVNFFENDLHLSRGKSNQILKIKADSIKVLIDKKIYQVSQISDRSLGIVLSSPNSKKTMLEGELLALKNAYGELLKSYELSDVEIRDAKPMFVKLDEPIPPLTPLKSSLLINLLKAIFFGGIVGSSIVILRKIFLDAIK